MGNGMCSRKQKKIFQFLLLITVIFGLIYGGMFSYEMHKQLKRTEVMAVKYQQHQESLSAQLQVVYEHRSRLEKSLQKERLDHKKSKEDYLVYKLESQQTLNKEKQDTSNRYNSLHAQHQMLKNQHEDLKKQFFHLQDEHQAQKDDHSKDLDEHREKYHQLQQTKELEISKFKENVYNLMGENKQLRKAHQDVHIQLQDVRKQHKDLQSTHNQLALTLEDHKSALGAAQLQVEEYKQLKETLNKMPSLRQVGQDRALNLPQPAPLNAVHTQNQPAHAQAQPPVEGAQGSDPRAGKELKAVQAEVQAAQGPGPKEGGAQEEERRRELAEEEMEQAGQPQRLEDSEQPQEEDEEEGEGEQGQPDENALDRDRQEAAQQPDAQREPPAEVERVKSPYEQQLEQQRLAVQMAEERRQLQGRQQALQQQRLQDQRERELVLRAQREREMQQHREADRKEKLLREQQLRQRNRYANMVADVVQGNEDPQNEEEEVRNPQMHLKQGQEKREDRGTNRQRNLAEEDMNPEDDPNNQGEDEFEEAQEQRGEAGPPANPNLPAVANQDGKGGIDGNTDQQEDALDDQYQEEGEEEAQDDLMPGQKQEVEVEEDPYNDENVGNVKQQAGPEDRGVRKEGAANEEDNYEEEDEEEVLEEEGAPGKRSNRRAEM